MSLWSRTKFYMAQGIRKFANLVHGKKKGSSTAQLSRSHVIEFTDNGLCSLLGGKWTSFRHMGEETVDEILKKNPDIKPQTHDLQTMAFNLIGSYSK